MRESVINYQHVKCPNFIRKDAVGGIKSIQCKLCGVTIADTVDRARGYERTKGGQLVKIIQRQLTRFSNYCEIKIMFNDPGYFHVTHGCRGCLHMNLSPDVLSELHAADQEESPDGFTDRERAQVTVGVLVLSTDQSGIV